MTVPLSRIYLAALFLVIRRAVQAVSLIDREVQGEIRSLPEGFTFTLSVFPEGPALHLKKTEEERLSSLLPSTDDQPMLLMEIKSVHHAFTLFTFRESTACSAARGNIAITGTLSHACAVIRILERVEAYLLPRFLACRAVKRYESPKGKHRKRMIVYLRILFLPGYRRA